MDKPADDVEFVIPEDLTTLTDEQLRELHAQATQHFDALYGDGTGLASDALEALGVLTEGIETLMRELDVRAEAARERDEAAAALAARAHPEAPPADDAADAPESDPVPEGEPVVEPPAEDTPPVVEGVVVDEPMPVAASAARREIRVNLGGLHSRQAAHNLPRPAHEARTMRDVVLASGDGTGYAQGQGVDWLDMGKIVDRRMQGFNEAQYAQANRNRQHLHQQQGVASFRLPFAPELMQQSSDPTYMEDLLKRAVDEKRLPGGSLVASGGWCAPSVTLYDLCELESRDGLLSLPTIGITRGGISWTPGPNFATIWAAGAGFHYLEADDIAGNYGGTVGNRTSGSKPCYKITCPSFTEARLEPDGLCLTAGLLMQRGYPEVISRTVRGALVAHDHIVSGNQLTYLAAPQQSTAVPMTTGTLGTVAPLLTAIEQQVEHYLYSQRMSRGTTLEAIFPYWIRAAIRSDIAQRAGLLDNLSVTDAQINGWFASRGISAQFVYDWQPITGNPEDFKAWPATVTFLLYAAGTWVLGQSDIITLDTLYDSVLLGTNDYVALFTENAYLIAKLCWDSRAVTVPVCPNGTTGSPVVLNCDGTTAVIGDQTRPVAGTVAGSSISSTGFTLTVSGASDAGVGLDPEPYRFSTDGGVTWTEWQTSNVKVVTGLTTGTLYHTRAEVRDKNGNTSTTPVVNVTTS